jgi:chemotaxis protein methyltransferase CheR
LTGLSSARIVRYLTPADGTWQINKPIRDRVTVFQHNLLDPVPDRIRSCQVVFCRNVLIYFAPHHSRTFLERLADALPAGASVFLGSAETLWQITDRFVAVKIDDSFVHRRPGDDALARAGTRPTMTEPPPVRMTPVPTRQVVRTPPEPRTTESDHARQAALIARIGQQALTAGDHHSAVIAFRKWAYLSPQDVMAHLHLGLALDAADDQRAAQRAYGVARRTLLKADPAHVEEGIEGYSTDQLRRFLATKNQEGAS